jgi:hypothetical protein
VRVVLLLSSALGCCVAPAVTLQFTLQELGDDQFRIHYDIAAVEFLTNQELEISFNPAVYRSLTNAVAPPFLDVLLFQPGDPLGAPGRFSALALVDNPLLSDGFSVDVRTFGDLVPGLQTFAINQLDERGVVVSVIAEGQTSAAIPEPASLGLVGAAMIIACASPVCRRRLKKPV